MTLGFMSSNHYSGEKVANHHQLQGIVQGTLCGRRVKAIGTAVFGALCLVALAVAIATKDENEKVQSKTEDPERDITERKEEKEALLALYKKRRSVFSWGNPVYRVALSEQFIKDEDLADLKAFTSLRDLDLDFTPIGDDGMRYIGGLASLVDLSLVHTKVGDAGVARLSNLTKLKRLNLGYTAITDKSLEAMAKLPSLESFTIQRTKTTDNGLIWLKDYKALRSEWHCRPGRWFVNSAWVFVYPNSVVFREPGIAARTLIAGTR